MCIVEVYIITCAEIVVSLLESDRIHKAQTDSGGGGGTGA